MLCVDNNNSIQFAHLHRVSILVVSGVSKFLVCAWGGGVGQFASVEVDTKQSLLEQKVFRSNRHMIIDKDCGRKLVSCQ